MIRHWFLSVLLSGGVLLSAAAGQAATPVDQGGKAHSLEELLDLVKQGRASEARENQAREQRFLQARDKQKSLLVEAEAERAAEDRRSSALEAAFAVNDLRLADLQKNIDSEFGSVKELSGVLQYAAIDNRRILDRSIVSGELPNRGARLAPLAEAAAGAVRLPTIEDIEILWYETLREMTEAGKIVTFRADVMQPDGARKAWDVLRVGAFSLTSGDRFIQYAAETGTLERLARQPAMSYREAAAAFQKAAPGSIAAYPVDPTRGVLLDRLVQQPSLYERIDRGGFISYLIIGLGLFCLLLIGERLLFLTFAGYRLRGQMSSDVPLGDNALGRVLSVYEQNRNADVETLDFKINESIMLEVPLFERWINIIRVISRAAPLLGLLGTAIGMVQTFQAVSLLGTGGTKILAAGVAQAMVPTVLGLVVAIPALFAHNLIASMSRRMVQILREQSAGIVAVHAEREHK
ncbi:MotA/TolQ/ExbB proton channel family protein [Govanella unica]|uniref:MotA/TolQ/ExbB proton channel family protein n=1 Tax=Govanella unica TaxID=2975056 RepID=A0A9X3TYE7_9PROT|nr:MotA/TolQ/ExbB proton channel family protein [Govania unica]MDA5193928.1 MotA/TolQ/ExbB proton channel family protein [Govania unica]